MRARFVDNFYGSSQVDPRHTGSVMTLPTRRAASINAATACLRSGIWVFAAKVRTIELSLSLFSYLTLSSILFFIRFVSIVCYHPRLLFFQLDVHEASIQSVEVFKRIFCSFQFDSIHRAVFCSLFIIEEENRRSFLLNVIVFLRHGVCLPFVLSRRAIEGRPREIFIVGII